MKDLLERLNQCETLLSQVAPRDGDGPHDTPGSLDDVAADSPATSYVSYEEARKQPNSRPSGRIVVDEGHPTFMESPLRSNVLDYVSTRGLYILSESDRFLAAILQVKSRRQFQQAVEYV